MASSSPNDAAASAPVSSDSSDEEPFSEASWNILLAIMDTVIPSIRKASSASEVSEKSALSNIAYDGVVGQIKSTATAELDNQLLEIYLAESPSTIPRFRELLRITCMTLLPQESKNKLAFFLGALK